MRFNVFGRSGCARTRRLMLRIERLMRRFGPAESIQLEFFDLETAAGLAEAAFRQLEGDLPVVVVEAQPPGRKAISGEAPFRDEALSALGSEVTPHFTPSLN